MNNDEIVARVQASPKYEKLVSTRHSYSTIMTIMMMVVYFGYILLVAFNKEWLATKIGAGMVTSIGIPMGVGVILFTIILTNIYVRRANSEFDDLNADLIKEVNTK